jgi:hypothetical protein
MPRLLPASESKSVNGMTASEFEILHGDLLALCRVLDRRFAEVEAKLSAKPSITTLYQAVVTLMLGIGAIVTSTVVVLNFGL